MTNSTFPVKLSFEPAFLEAHIDELAVRLEVDCFPLIESDVVAGHLIVDGDFDPDLYSVNMAVDDALVGMGESRDTLWSDEEG